MAASYQSHHLSASDTDFTSHPYLNRQLIAYIGNKRRILGFLSRIFRSLEEDSAERRVVRKADGGGKGGIRSFADPFAGTGSVARLARLSGYQVRANDWEEYSRLLNSAYLLNSPSDLSSLFGEWGGLETLLGYLNGLEGEPATPFIAEHYAPNDTHSADYRSERLFYTRENALFIDRVREKIEELYPERGVQGGEGLSGGVCHNDDGADAAVGNGLDPRRRRAKELLLALLLYEAATHANTSGVFKAYHKGFGGHGKDALRRITSPMELEYPVLVENDPAVEVSSMDAVEFLSGRSVDLCYLDPPYNGHQYGSNYHLLNTIALWDFPAVEKEWKADGSLRSKAGIREDWNRTRSDFCYRDTAPQALRDVLEAADCRYVVLSYNSEGIIPFEQLYMLLSDYGRVEINTLDYVKYRGGRQSISRKVHNFEFQLLLYKEEGYGGERVRADGTPEALSRFLRLRRIVSLFQEAYVPEKVRARMPVKRDFGIDSTGDLFGESFDSSNGTDGGPDRNSKLIDEVKSLGEELLVSPLPERPEYRFPMENLYTFLESPGFDQLEELTSDELERLEENLSEAVCSDRREEFEVLLSILRKYRRTERSSTNSLPRNKIKNEGKKSKKYQRRLINVLKKFTHKKYKDIWTREAQQVETLLEEWPGTFPILEKEYSELKNLAELRFNG